MVEDMWFSFRGMILETIMQVAEWEKSAKEFAADVSPRTVADLLSELGQLNEVYGAGGCASWCHSVQKGQAALQGNWAI